MEIGNVYKRCTHEHVDLSWVESKLGVSVNLKQIVERQSEIRIQCVNEEGTKCKASPSSFSLAPGNISNICFLSVVAIGRSNQTLRHLQPVACFSG